MKLNEMILIDLLSLQSIHLGKEALEGRENEEEWEALEGRENEEECSLVMRSMNEIE